MCLYIWGSDNDPYTQAVHFIDGLGNMFGPLIVAPFLQRNNTTHKVTSPNISTSFSLLSNVQNYTTLSPPDVVVHQLNQSAEYKPEEPEDNYKYAYIIVGSISITVAMIVIAIWLYAERTCWASHTEEESESDDEDNDEEAGKF